jgi:hypothetical protein
MVYKQIHTLTPLTPEKGHPVPTGQGNGRAADPTWVW